MPRPSRRLLLGHHDPVLFALEYRDLLVVPLCERRIKGRKSRVRDRSLEGISRVIPDCVSDTQPSTSHLQITPLNLECRPVERITARSMTFCISRTLPGQDNEAAPLVSDEIVSIPFCRFRGPNFF